MGGIGAAYIPQLQRISTYIVFRYLMDITVHCKIVGGPCSPTKKVGGKCPPALLLLPLCNCSAIFVIDSHVQFGIV